MIQYAPCEEFTPWRRHWLLSRDLRLRVGTLYCGLTTNYGDQKYFKKMVTVFGHNFASRLFCYILYEESY